MLVFVFCPYFFDSAVAVSVTYATSDGTAEAGEDYVATQGNLNWTAGNASPIRHTSV